jgi:hypothetical protein
MTAFGHTAARGVWVPVPGVALALAVPVLALVPEVEQLHRQFTDRLRAALGRVPGTGFPRISRMRPGQTRFTLTDVAGNAVIFIKHGDEDEAATVLDLALARHPEAPAPDRGRALAGA